MAGACRCTASLYKVITCRDHDETCREVAVLDEETVHV